MPYFKIFDLRKVSNVDHFVVERSADGVSFSTLATVNVSADAAKTFKTMDVTPLDGANVYRLMVIAKDGSFYYSNNDLLNFSAIKNALVYPNPAIGLVNIALEEASTSEIEVLLTNQYGQEVKRATVAAGSQLVELSVEGVTSGVYYIQVLSDAHRGSKQKLVIKSRD